MRTSAGCRYVLYKDAAPTELTAFYGVVAINMSLLRSFPLLRRRTPTPTRIAG